MKTEPIAWPARTPDDLARPRFQPAIVALVGATWLPYAVRGVGWLEDDWVFLRNAALHGIASTGAPRQVGRPGAEVVYAFIFGVIGDHPLVAYVALGVLRAAAALVLFGALREWFGPRPAFVTVFVWVVMANHLSLEQWASTAQATVALIPLVIAARWQVRMLRAHRVEDRRTPAVVGLGLLLACLSYELVLPVAAVVAVLPVLLWRREGIRSTAFGAAGVAASVAWILSQPRVYTDPTGSLRWGRVVPAVFGFGLAHSSLAANALGLAVIAMGVAVCWSHRAAPDKVTTSGLILVGGGVIVLGLVPLLKFGTTFEGLDDRLNLVTSIGTALMVAGIAATLPRRASVALIGAIVMLSVPVRLEAADRYHLAAVEARAEIDQLVAALSCRSSVVMTEEVPVHAGVSGLGDGYNATGAVQLRTGNEDLTVQTPRGLLVGPPPVSNPKPRECPP